MIESTCPACRRIIDQVPAGYLKLNGRFLAKHRDEIIRLAINYSSTVTERKPLSRIVTIITPEDGTLQIAFTDMKLPVALGDVIQKAYHGQLSPYIREEGNIVYVSWER